MRQVPDYLAIADRALAAFHAGKVHPCVECLDAETGSATVLYCSPCWTRRQAHGKVLYFDPDRRRRAASRLAGRACSTCGGISWTVTTRGDSWCSACYPGVMR